jgi:hypothetical protein
MGLGDRIARLEERRAPPPHETPPIVTLLVKSMDAQRRELDGRPPDPANAVLTPEERAADLDAARGMLEWVKTERARGQPPDTLARLLELEEHAKQHLREGTSA